MRLLTDQALLVVVDIQERLFPHINNPELLEDKLVRLIQGIRLLDVPILVSEQYVKGLGPTIAPLREALGDIPRLEKMSFSSYDDPGFKQALDDTGRKVIILCGIESHVCVQQTALDLKEAGYTPVVVADAVSSRNPNDKEIALQRMNHEGIRMATVESILFELTRYSGTELFKSVSRLIK